MTTSVAHPGVTFQSKNQASEVPGSVIPSTTSAVAHVYEGVALEQLVSACPRIQRKWSLALNQARTISAADLNTHVKLLDADEVDGKPLSGDTLCCQASRQTSGDVYRRPKGSGVCAVVEFPESGSEFDRFFCC